MENNQNLPNQLLFDLQLNQPNEKTQLTIEEEEQLHFKTIVSAFFNYNHDSQRDVNRSIRNFTAIGEQIKLLKQDYKIKIQKLQDAIEVNTKFVHLIVRDHIDLFNFKINENDRVQNYPLYVDAKNVSKMRSTIKQFIREWSQDGQKEREECYGVIIDEFKQYFPNPIKPDQSLVRVLFPGCGLGRIVLEFAALGYGSQGNEFSYFMLLGSNFILNCVEKVNQFEIRPFIHTFCNHFENDDPFKSYYIPDVNPFDLVKEGQDFSMVAGEFIEVYKNQIEQWDSVVTCFFVDTANNVIDYVKTIYNILKKGGVWINFGPLLYHYAEMEEEVSIELSWEELQHIIEQLGFEIKQQQIKETTYASESKTMMKVVYRCIFFTAVKK